MTSTQDNYSKVNAVLIERHSSRSRDELLEDLRSSARAMKDYLRSLDASEWDRDFGVRHRGAVVTIRSSVVELIDDYDHHKEQIASWKDTHEQGRRL